MLRISSWMSTVLPTPAPPNRPTLPPRWYGASRSTTLMPVSKSCFSGSCSSNVGAGRWIGSLWSAFTGPFPSIVSPVRLKIRPRQPSPTGTEIGAPVSTASMPRTRPSVESIAMQRTMLSPTCSAASTVRRMSFSLSSMMIAL